MAVYNYAITGPTSTFLNDAVDPSVLTTEILASSITATLDYINTDAAGNNCAINFLTALSAPEQTTLNNLIGAHTGIAPIAIVPTTVDTPGTAIDGRIPVENGTSGSSIRQSLASISAAGSINIPTGQKFKINDVALAKNDITGLAAADTPAFVNINLSGLGASSIVLTDAAKNLVASAAPKTGFNQDFSIAAADIKMNGSQSLGALNTLARADHIHPSDTSRAALVASPVANQILLTNASGQPVVSGKTFNDVGTTVNDIWSASQINTAINNGISSNQAMVYKGVLDCSTNPNYPSATVGWTYKVSVAGKIGGASGINVEVGDMVLCQTTNAGGTQAAVGTSWNIIQSNIDGAITTADASSVANRIVIESGTTGKVYGQSLASVNAAGGINIPAGQTYQINSVAIAQANIVGLTIADSPTFVNVTHSGLTANMALVANASKQVTSSGITATELGYVAGVTSAIQTQIGGKEPLISVKNTAFNVNFETLVANIKMNGAVSIGVLSTAARGDHVHPTDTTKVDKIAGSVANNLVSFSDTTGIQKDSGISSSSISTVITNTHTHANKANLDTIDQNLGSAGTPTFANITDSGLTASQIVMTDATKKLISLAQSTGFNLALEVSTANIKMNGAVAVGVLNTLARADHIHPSDTSREPLITLGSTSQYFRGDKSFQTLDKNAVGLGAVANVAQLTRAAADYNSFASITPLLTDVTLLEDASNAFAKGKVTLQDIKNLIVPVFGQNYQFAQAEARTTTTSTSFQNKVTLSAIGLPAGNYRIACNFAWDYPSTARFFLGRMFLDGATLLWNMSQAPGNTGTALFNSASGFNQIALTAGDHAFTLDYCTSNAGSAAGIQNARLELWRIS